MDAWAYYLQAAATKTATATQAAARATAEGEAAMILLQLSSGFRGGANPPGEPAEEELLPVAVAEHEIIPADHVAGAQDAPEVEHVSGAAALLPMTMPGHVSGGAALYKSAPVPVEHRFGIITGSSSSSLAKVAASSSEVVRDKKGKLAVVSDAAKKPIIKKRGLHDIQLQAAQGPPARRIPLPLPASSRRFMCTRCRNKFPTYQALGGHMASHSRANKYGTDGQQQLVAQLAVARAVQSVQGQGRAVPRANTAGTSSGLIFRTGGQAPLGGHKRRHWVADKARAEAAGTRAAIDDAAAASAPAAPRGEPRDFDLNEMPSEE